MKINHMFKTKKARLVYLILNGVKTFTTVACVEREFDTIKLAKSISV